MAESADPYRGMRKIPNLFKADHENRIVRVVPLVYWIGNLRFTIGKATLREDGIITAEINEEYKAKVKHKLEEE